MRLLGHTGTRDPAVGRMPLFGDTEEDTTMLCYYSIVELIFYGTQEEASAGI
jgi:hypothetical protein